MTSARCDEVRDVVSELAVGLVAGEERARLLEHLLGCPSCRAEVAAAAAAADALLLAVPREEPPPGFEDRVLGALAVAGPGSVGARAVERSASPGAPGRGRRSPSRWPRPAVGGRRVAAVAAAIVVLLLAAGAGAVVQRVSGGRPTSRAAAMRTPDGTVVGRVVVARQPDAVFVALPGWRDDRWSGDGAGYRLRITLTDGSVRSVGPVVLDGRDAWGTVTGFPGDRVARVAMVDAAGRVYCSARL
ncbi:MAG: zf-HC2 domain-containing protein [Actinobacteria bacterium]|nr:zf-HC2 domain-containing protein [Actinomycetota bacterium]